MCLQTEHDALSGLGRDELSRNKVPEFMLINLL